MITLLILITFSLVYILILFGENSCWSLLGLKGIRDLNYLTTYRFTPFFIAFPLKTGTIWVKEYPESTTTQTRCFSVSSLWLLNALNWAALKQAQSVKSQLSILCIFWNGKVNYHVFYPILILIYLLCGKELWNHILQIKFHHWHPKKTKILLQQSAKNLGCQCCWLMLLSLSSQCLFSLYTAWYITQ